jgi:archaellin
MKRKGEMGISALVLFIALVLVAAIAGVVIIQTSGSMQEKTLSTTDQSKGDISTHLSVLDVIGNDGRDRSLDYFRLTMKLSAGSESIRLDDSVMTIIVGNTTSTLVYAGTESTYENGASGYYTLREGNSENITGGPSNWGDITYDYDLDQVAENISGGSDMSNVSLILSSGVVLNIGYCNESIFYPALGSNPYISNFNATCGAGASTNDTTSVYLQRNDTDVPFGTGFFAVEYLQSSNNHIPGMVNRGEIIRVYFESPKEVIENERLTFTFIPRTGAPTILKITTPEVMSRETIPLFP